MDPNTKLVMMGDQVDQNGWLRTLKNMEDIPKKVPDDMEDISDEGGVEPMVSQRLTILRFRDRSQESGLIPERKMDRRLHVVGQMKWHHGQQCRTSNLQRPVEESSQQSSNG